MVVEAARGSLGKMAKVETGFMCWWAHSQITYTLTGQNNQKMGNGEGEMAETVCGLTNTFRLILACFFFCPRILKPWVFLPWHSFGPPQTLPQQQTTLGISSALDKCCTHMHGATHTKNEHLHHNHHNINNQPNLTAAGTDPNNCSKTCKGGYGLLPSSIATTTTVQLIPLCTPKNNFIVAGKKHCSSIVVAP